VSKFIVSLMSECRIAAWTVRGVTPPLLSQVPKVCAGYERRNDRPAHPSSDAGQFQIAVENLPQSLRMR